MDLLGRQVRDGDDTRKLTALEVRLLACLALRADADVSREELLAEVWGYAPGASTRAVDFAVRRLRGKLGEAGHTYLLTSHGIGYRLVLGTSAPPAPEPVPRPPLRLSTGALDLERRQFTPDGGAPVPLSAREVALLELLAGSPGFVKREQIERTLWRRASPNVYLALVQRLRRKLGDAIVARRATGVRLERAERRRTLPATGDRFLDRAERERALQALASERTVTLTGPAGVGKTRLALELARELFDREPGLEVWWAGLANASGTGSFLQAMARALGIDWVGSDAAAQLGRVIAGPARVLVVFDNFEQLVDQAPIVAGWLAEAPGARALITSRRGLPLTGVEVELQPLPLPAAAAMFEDRAQAACPGVVLEPALVTEIVTRLEGLPLAIELAATRAEQLPFLAANLHRRLDVLIRGASDAPQRTLRGALDLSWDLLDERAREALIRLGQFRGTAPRSLLDGDAPAVDMLCTHSLARAVPEGVVLSETVRLYAQERLALSGQIERARREHAERVVGAATAACEGIGRADRHGPALALLRLLRDDLRALSATAPEPWGAEAALRLYLLLTVDGPLVEGLELLRPHAADPRVQVSLGEALAQHARFEEAMACAERAQSDAATAPERWRAERLVAHVLRRSGRMEEALAHLQRTCDAIPAKDVSERWMCLNNLGNLLMNLGRYEASYVALHEGAALGRTLGNVLRQYQALTSLSLLCVARGSWAEGIRVCEEASDLARALDSPYLLARTSCTAGAAACGAGELDRADALLHEAYTTLRAMGCQAEVVEILARRAEVFSMQDRPEEALALYRAALETHPVRGDHTEGWLLANQAIAMLMHAPEAESLPLFRRAAPLVLRHMPARSAAVFHACFAIASAADPPESAAHLATARSLGAALPVVELVGLVLAGDAAGVRDRVAAGSPDDAPFVLLARFATRRGLV